MYTLRTSLALLEADEKGVAFTDTPGGNHRMTTVSESGLYVLIMVSIKSIIETLESTVTTIERNFALKALNALSNLLASILR